MGQLADRMTWIGLIGTRAEVIKIEHPTKGDDTRHWGPPYAPYKQGTGKTGGGESAYFISVAFAVVQPAKHKLTYNR